MPTHSILLVAFVCSLITLSVTSASTPCSKLHAAFTFRETVYFVHGDHVTGFSYDGQWTYEGGVGDLGFDKPITAAVGDQGYQMFFLQSGKEEQGFYDFAQPNDVQPRYWSRAEHEFAKIPGYQGIDAAFHRGLSNIVYMAGCHYVEISMAFMKVVQSGSLEDVGIPCHVDAAWSSANAEYGYVVKGLKLYAWNAYASRAFHEIFVYDWFPYLLPLGFCADREQ